jgi:ribosome biogenesis GTPase
LPSRIVGKLRLDDIKTTNPVGVGDQVTVELDGGDTTKGIISEVLPRRNYVVRQSPRKKHELHLLASNIDQAVLVTTIIQPNLKMGFIDRFLLMTEPHDIPVIIVVNKSDLFEKRKKKSLVDCRSCTARSGTRWLVVPPILQKDFQILEIY